MPNEHVSQMNNDSEIVLYRYIGTVYVSMWCMCKSCVGSGCWGWIEVKPISGHMIFQLQTF